MSTKKYLLIIFLFLAIAATVWYVERDAKNNNVQPIAQGCANGQKIDFKLPTTEILSAEIGVAGGALRGKDDKGQWVMVNIPAGAVKQKTKIDLKLEESAYKIKSGIRSPLSFTITPDMSFNQPVRITVLYEKKYSCDKITTVVPFLIKKDNSLSAVVLLDQYKNQNMFIMATFHGGTYSWVYAE